MNQSSKYINVVDTVEINGCYLEEKRNCGERRKNIKHYVNRYERRLQKHRRQQIHIDIQV